MEKLRVAILGGTGYGGAELLRILLFHQDVEVRHVTSRSHAGDRADSIHPNLLGLTDLKFEELDRLESWDQLDLVFSALPHGEASSIVRELPRQLRIIDLSGDFRISDPSTFQDYYGITPPDVELQRDFVYGLTEVNREQIAGAGRVANPGCFATATLLALFPLVDCGLVEGRLITDAKTGSSGSGAKASDSTHHPRRANTLVAYKVFRHQHLPEILQVLSQGRNGNDPRLIFQTHSTPLVRGVFVTSYCTLVPEAGPDEVLDCFRNAYSAETFVRLRDCSPDVNWVKNTNFVDIGWSVQGRDLIVFSALDNLLKGAAGQAVQNMNVMFGFPEDRGISFIGSHP